MEKIESKVVIITGASSGIGKATAKLLAKKGAKVVLAARREERLQEVVREIEQEGGEASMFKVDVTSSEDMKKLADFALKKYGRIDVLVNNAGIMPISRLNELRVEEWDRMIDVNIKGVLYGIAAVLPTMRERRSGHIINIASVAGHVVMPTSAVYSATKYSVRAITEGLRQEESAASRIRATIISPGVTETELIHTVNSPEVQAMAAHLKEVSISPDRIASAIAHAIDMPEDTSVNEIVIRPTVQSM
ncbi:SDR family oxidoreductase [Paenibacillus mucilaginosus]|uniref:Short-chain dehydrogenase/reductase SDR n=1 Tax=Paenibacillus mucilaginosus (strain KNP414) TaxID=1036673 RepID=F8F6H1_PAEMK|nr:SDR family oxidoreductase [Paenibacillus mucilaginosus]AEI42925.1 short-chain dehydrogenase/reductase SDR [Paenibacillus mucilaginosus KNP414]MCG7216040.1 SDR family oxidoreductase [Paenibacillus mucilaginosus]WDM24570.1 SDR family oxidoreductase [Paenibacillus mucilaginosus]